VFTRPLSVKKSKEIDNKVSKAEELELILDTTKKTINPAINTSTIKIASFAVNSDNNIKTGNSINQETENLDIKKIKAESVNTNSVIAHSRSISIG
jgi:hypothetical protein